MLNAGTALNKLEKRLPDVTVAMCSVRPRCGSGRWSAEESPRRRWRLMTT